MKKMKFNRAPSIIWKSPKQFIAFGFGIGAIPIIPGTFGTAVGVLFYLLLYKLSLLLYLGIAIVAFIASCWLCDVCSKEINEHDHGGMVIDEIVGFLFVMIAIPFSWKHILIGFLLFRFFDIVKPWPISWADKHIHGGFGVMFDDLLAAIAANISLWLLIKFVLSE